MVGRIGENPDIRSLDTSVSDAQSDPAGELRGETVIREKSVASLVQDSLEEVTFSVAEQVESADVQDVEIEDLAASIEDRIKKITKLKDQLEGARDGLDQHKIHELLATLRGRDDADADEILDELAKRFGDPTDQYAALDSMLQELGRRQGTRDLRRAFKKASDTLWEQHATEIIAGLHANPIAQRFAHGNVQQFQVLREAYRAQVQERPTMLQSLRNLRERFGDDRLENQVSFLIAAAGRDLDALVSSVEKSRLGEIVDDLSRLQLISSMRAQAGTIVARTSKRFGAMGGKRDWDLLDGTMELMEDKWVGSPKVEAMSGTLSVREIEGQIYFIRELNAFFRNVPVKAYADPDSRERLLLASQEALDHLIEREEEEL